jgi:hypothetical protein
VNYSFHDKKESPFKVQNKGAKALQKWPEALAL